MTYRIYCDGRDFGEDFSSSSKAFEIRDWYAAYWVRHTYVVRDQHGRFSARPT